MSKFSREHTVLACSLVVLLAGIAWYAWYYSHLGNEHMELETARLEQAKLHAIEAKKDARALLLSKTQADREELDTFMLSRDDPNALLDLVEQLGTDVGVTVTVDTLKEEGGVSEEEEQGTAVGTEEVSVNASIRMLLTIEGPWDGVFHVLSMLESLPYVALVDQVAIEEDGAGIWKGQVQMRVLMQ